MDFVKRHWKVEMIVFKNAFRFCFTVIGFSEWAKQRNHLKRKWAIRFYTLRENLTYSMTVFRKCVWTVLSSPVMPLTYDPRSIPCCLLVSQRGKVYISCSFEPPCTILCPAGHVSVLPVRHPCHCPAALPSWETARLTVGVTHRPQMGSLKISSNSERTVCIRSTSVVLPPLIGTITDSETNAWEKFVLYPDLFSKYRQIWAEVTGII